MLCDKRCGEPHMIITFVGTVGSGKTLAMTYEAWKYYRQGFKVYSNYNLSFPHTKLTKAVFDGMIAHKEQLQDAVLCLDEIHVWLDSRSSMQKKNKVITYFILQTRKRAGGCACDFAGIPPPPRKNVMFVYCVQHSTCTR